MDRGSKAAVDAIIVGAGFAGLYMLHRLRRLGLRAVVLEAAGGVGGTWYWNRYPGARCDVESIEYSYAFDDDLQQAWDWTERYAAQPEILRYAEHVAERFDLLRDIVLQTRVHAARFDEDRVLWEVAHDNGVSRGRFLILATGCLSMPNRPAFKGEARYRGNIYHTGLWPHRPVHFDGQRVAVIGTGSSAIQSIPVIARQADRLFVFQRQANFAVPAHNRPLSAAEMAAVKADYPALRADTLTRRSYVRYDIDPRSALEVDEATRQAQYQARWDHGGLGYAGAFVDQMTDARANAPAAEFIRKQIRTIVDDPATAERLSPTSIVGCKRLCVEIGYFETFNRRHVELVDIRQGGIERFTETGLVAGDRAFEVDSIVLATGFDAMTGSINRIAIEGRDGRRLDDAWAEGPKSYLGLAIAGFPNLFTITGPGSPSVLSNMIPSIEQHVDWITALIETMAAAGQSQVEAEDDAQQRWVRRVAAIADGTLYPHCNSWYLGANVAGKPRVFMPFLGCPPYREICDQIAASDYHGFVRA